MGNRRVARMRGRPEAAVAAASMNFFKGHSSYDRALGVDPRGITSLANIAKRMQVERTNLVFNCIHAGIRVVYAGKQRGEEPYAHAEVEHMALRLEKLEQ